MCVCVCERESEEKRREKQTYPSFVLCFLLVVCEGLNLVENGGRFHGCSTTSVQNVQYESSQTGSNCLTEGKIKVRCLVNKLLSDNVRTHMCMDKVEVVWFSTIIMYMYK